MSLLNVFLTPSQALIGTDTECVEEATGDYRDISKALYIPHLHVVTASRGNTGFFSVAFAMMWQGQARNFDELAGGMSELLGNAHSMMLQARPDFAASRFCDEQQIVIVGWSAEANCMRAFLYEQTDRAEGFTEMEIEGSGYIMPWEDHWGDEPETDGHLGMADLALAQTRNAKQESPKTPMGGRLIVAELTRNDVHFTTSCDLSTARPTRPRFDWQPINIPI